MGRDSATFQDKGTEVPSLSRDKGAMGQAQNLTTGQDGQGQPVKTQEVTWDGTITIFCQNPGRDMGLDAGQEGTGQSLFFFQ